MPKLDGKSIHLLWLLVVGILFIFLATFFPVHDIFAAQVRYSGRLSPNDYLFGSQEQYGDPIFDHVKPIELNASVGVNTDCGNINFDTTLQSTFGQILDKGFLLDLGKGMVKALPMLTICYASPTLCAILKHSQISANLVSNMRLNQCALVDKYVDSRVEDYYQERQSCVHQAIGTNGGNMDAALESCKSSNQELTDWAGLGNTVTTNKLLDSSAKWAGLDTQDTQGPVNLVKALVGDTVLAQGSISVEYGPRRTPLTPRTYLQNVEKNTYDQLCRNYMNRIDQAGPDVPVEQVISEWDLKSFKTDSGQLPVDRSTLRALASMSPSQRDRACKKLSDAIAMTQFSNEMNRSLDILSTLAQNPNLPNPRKEEIQEKRKALKDQIEVTVELQKQRSEPLNQVLAQIHEQGDRLQSQAVADDLGTDASVEANRKMRTTFLDCSDGVMCQSNPGD